MVGAALVGRLEDDAYAVDWVSDGAAGLESLRTHRYDVVLLDLGLPDLDGTEFLARARRRGDEVAVIVVTARDEVGVRITTLDRGADDYLVKPFDTAELMARIRAVLRRGGTGTVEAVLANGHLMLDLARHRATSGDETEVDLSRREFAVLRALMSRPGVILSREEIEHRVYGWGREVESNAVEYAIHRLRSKLGGDAIRNVRGVGWTVPSERERLVTPRSLTSRLSVVLVLATLVVAGAAGVWSYRQALAEAQGLQDDVLQQVATLAVSASSRQLSTDGKSPADSAADIDVTTLAESRLDPGTPSGLLTAGVAGVERRADGAAPVVASQPLAARNEIAHDAALSAVLPLLVLLPVLLLALVLAARRLLAPVDLLADEVRGRDVSDLGPLDEHRAPVELRGFIEALNAQLQRVASAVAHERTFIAQAAHELRTPLTAASLQLERAAGAPDEARPRERLVELRGGIDRSRHVVDQLLDLARAHADVGPGITRQRFGVLLRGVLSDLLPLADRAGTELVVESGADERTLLPAAAATSCLRNVVDNAIRYGGGGGPIIVQATRRADRLLVTVDDGGPGVSAPQEVLRPFVRPAPQEVEGSGLGLAVVAEQMRRAGGAVAISRTDRFPTGTRVRLEFLLLDHLPSRDGVSACSSVREDQASGPVSSR